MHSVDHRNSHQVLFMDENDVENMSRSNHPISYYQVATPKSPHELSSLADNEDNESVHSSHPHEDAERLKFMSAKREILDQLNLQIMLTHKEMENIIEENDKVSGQLEVLKIMHRDPKLMDKISQYQESRAKEQEERIKAGFYSSNDDAGEGNYYYHTRSKSGSKVGGLRPANDNVIDLRMRATKTLPQQTPASEVVPQPGPSLASMMPHQNRQRNFSSTCATSNSGVIGTTDVGQPIFRRPDGILIIITCSECGREGFTSAQGIVNHMRLKHFLHYQSQPLAVLSNQIILPDEKQNADILSKFKELKKSPLDSYLSSCTPQPANDKRTSKETVVTNPIVEEPTTIKSTKHLQKMYTKDDFNEIVDYVKDAKNDLDTILKYEDEDGVGTASEEDTKPKPRKRSLLNERNKPAEKKARPDVIHVTENHIPEEDKRSRHYNLRAKSKLRAYHRDD
ncbi:unnamed protein product [Kluyveromyces dobzhanskii CBS 2104]|uniref:WGS project CCBQ000000000 data, contig 00017 n=1 Tax=Kluyveromyces dobzhanskii CBS 2104 TaxID=1427455 RepID=A0A0A8L921_9SACH|nr:unnamed protein product [Kluyveromyces dobzhanskii CBS 2104]